MTEAAPPRREQSAVLRRLAHWGALEGPAAFLRLSPKPIGAAFGLLLPRVRQQLIANSRRIHGARSGWREQLDAVSTLANYAACFAEGMAAGRDDVALKVQVDGEGRLRQAVAEGGVVVVTAHVGPWELTAQLLGQEVEADVVVVMQPEPNAAARELQDRWRNERGLKVLHIGSHPTDALPLVSHLKRGGVAALQMDRVPPSGRALSVSLFGTPFDVPEGPFRLAALSGAKLVPAFARRTGFFSYELQVAEPIGFARRADLDDLRAGAQRAADAMQAFIRQSSTQWFHFQDR